MANKHLDGLDVKLKDACGLACLHRGNQALCKGQIGLGGVGLGGGFDDLGARQHIACNGVILRNQMPGPVNAISAGVGRKIALRIQHMRLTDSLTRIAPDKIAKHVLGALLHCQTAAAFGAPDRVAEGLRGDRDGGPHIRHRRPTGKEAGGDDHANRAVRRVFCDQRKGHRPTA